MSGSHESVLGGRYRLGRELGRGATSLVWLGHDTRRNDAVAIKILYPALARDRQAVADFRREARLAIGIEHPHLVGGYAWGERPRPHLVMGYVDGPSLRQVLERPAGFGGSARTLARELHEALAWLHGRGVVHCDVAAGNVLIASDGSVWLTDFGIARPLHGKRERSRRVTGTPPYIAPEVRHGRPPTVRSDLYAVGVLISERVRGRPDTGMCPLVSALTAIGPAQRPTSAREAALLLDQPRAVAPSSRHTRLRTACAGVIPVAWHEQRRGFEDQPAAEAFSAMPS